MFKTRQCARVVTSLYEDALKPSGLGPAQLSLLVAIHLASGINITKLSEMLVMDRTTLSRNLKPLVSAGLVRMERADDPRARLVELTNQGRDRLALAIPLWKQAQARVVERVGQERLTAIYQHLGVLIEAARMN